MHEALARIERMLQLLLIRQRQEIWRSIDQETSDLATILRKLKLVNNGSDIDEQAKYLESVAAKLDAMGKDVSETKEEQTDG
jgi:hypothetical protein